MKKFLAIILAIGMMLSLCACGQQVKLNAHEADSTEANNEPQAKAIGESFVTDKFTLTVSDFQFIRSANFSDYSYDYEDIVTDTYDSDTVIAYFRYNINNTGSSTYRMAIVTPTLVAGDIRYDGHLNGVACSHCITTDDASDTVSPLENKEFNYCIFNIPTAIMSQPSLALEFEMDGQVYTFTIK